MRTIQEITTDLNASINEVSKAKEAQNKANKEADELIKRAGEMKSNANIKLNETQDKAIGYRREYEELMRELLPANDGRVRVSG